MMLPQTASLYGWIAIAILYVIMGVMAAGGTILASQKIFRIHYERSIHGYILMVIAGFYAAFVAHFGDGQAWYTELAAIAIFILIGFLGVFLTHVLALGYLAHGVWDFVHELHQLFGMDVLKGMEVVGPVELTTLPMLYGVFCLTYDLMIVAYIYYRRSEWTH